MKYSMFIGRWQPWHNGHRWLIDQRLKENKNVLICIREVDRDDSNPYDFGRVKAEIHAACVEFGDKIKVVELPNITDVFYGRGVGYNIEQLELSKELQQD